MRSECVEYVLYYKKNLFEARIDVDAVGDIFVDVFHTSFSFRYVLMSNGYEESNVWLEAIKSVLRVDPPILLRVIEEILNEGMILNERTC